MPRERESAWLEDDEQVTQDARGGPPAPVPGTMRPAGPYAGIGPRGYVRSDHSIYEDVCDRLMRSPELDASDVEVSVRAGEVTLAGWVDDREQKRLAEDLAEAASGVQDVHNRVRLRHPPGVGAAGVGREGRGCED